ncbi:hypothetical protein LCGC14_1265340 [marine sediment metagenome]|uniref:Uncharacterized protein n=1 Tax=marine sediment metagenome TaxID=412755 RepID=A0A0F9NGH2_9ZZZZ
MDTTYIKMCDCEEIQEIKIKKRLPSHLVCEYWQTSDRQIIDLDGDLLYEVEDEYNISGTRYIWLPTQSQLQEMSFYSWGEQYKQLSQFISKHPVPLMYKSWKQLWLAFVMFHLYQKIWVNGEWIEEK